MKTVAGVKRQKLEDSNSQPQVIRVAVPVQLKSLNDEERTIEFVGSTPAKDSYGDVIEQNWELTRFLNNPVVPWAHDYRQPPVAKALEVGYTNGNLSFKAQFATADEYPWADTIYKLYKGGYLRAFSVGFLPIEYEGNWEDGYTFKKCELLEVSCVTVPANPEALVLAFEEGLISDRERKSMIAKAKTLIKTLTLEGETPHSEEDMEMPQAIKDLTETLKTTADQLRKATEVAENLVAVIKDADDEEEANPTPPPADPGEPGPEAPGGTEEEETTHVLADIDADELKSAVGNAVKGAIDYQLGKVT